VMPDYFLRLSVPECEAAELSCDNFLWSKDSRGSFSTTAGPRLVELGPVPQPNIEFVRVAVGVYAADRTAPRGSTWSQRQIGLRIPVWDPDRWTAVSLELAALLGFLSGDLWQLEFVRANTPRDRSPMPRAPRVQRVVLLSGGSDSLCGALLSRAELGDAPQALVSHYSSNHVSPIQRALLDSIERVVPGGPLYHHQVRLLRRSHQPLSGLPFRNEYSTRTRSLLFIALGLAVASIDGVPLWMPENGFASLNPPLSPERRGSLSTRTTHPSFLSGLSTLLDSIAVHGEISNPFTQLTKGEVFQNVARLLGDEEASRLLSMSHSCGHTGAWTKGFPAAEQCGVCFGCIVRRAGFLAAGLTDHTRYISDRVASPERDSYLSKKSAIPSARFFVNRGIRMSDIASLSLPRSYPAEEAYELCQRGISELRQLWN
jgi:hypothetical protein